jgi:hypothetical protein
MLNDGVTTRQQQGKADPAARVADISTLLLRSIKESS